MAIGPFQINFATFEHAFSTHAHSKNLHYNHTAILLSSPLIWGLSSAGLEHYLDRVGVEGSNPSDPTVEKKSTCVRGSYPATHGSG